MVLTDDGRRAVDAFLPEVVALQTTITAGVTETERRQLQRSLAKMRAAIETIDADGAVAAAPRRVAPGQRRV